MSFLFAFSFNRAVKKGDLVLKGIPGALEALLEALYNMTESTAGKWAWTIFPWFASITILVLFANWMELIPGVDSIGVIEHAEAGGFGIQHLGAFFTTLVNPAVTEGGYQLVPFVRVVSTDLNFTVALAIIAVIAVQVVGIRAQGIKYFTKFWNVKTFFSRPIFGVIDWGVGLLELVSEFSKVLSFAFRLFGNIFAGSVLLFVMGSLLGTIAIFPSAFLYVGISGWCNPGGCVWPADHDLHGAGHPGPWRARGSALVSAMELYMQDNISGEECPGNPNPNGGTPARIRTRR